MPNVCSSKTSIYNHASKTLHALIIKYSVRISQDSELMSSLIAKCWYFFNYSGTTYRLCVSWRYLYSLAFSHACTNMTGKMSWHEASYVATQATRGAKCTSSSIAKTVLEDFNVNKILWSVEKASGCDYSPSIKYFLTKNKCDHVTVRWKECFLFHQGMLLKSNKRQYRIQNHQNPLVWFYTRQVSFSILPNSYYSGFWWFP